MFLTLVVITDHLYDSSKTLSFKKKIPRNIIARFLILFQEDLWPYIRMPRFSLDLGRK